MDFRRGMAKRILFITSTRVGDAVLSTGLLGRLVTDNPDARFTIACGPAAADLFQAVPGLERLIVLDKKRFSLHWLDLWWACCRTFWDVVVDLRNAPLTLLIPARRHYRMGRKDGGHRLERIARVMGIDGPPPAPKIWITDAHRQTAARLIPGDRPVLAVGPTANWRGKTWPEERFAEVTARLTGPKGIMPGAPVAVFGHGSERASVAGFLAGIPEGRRIDLVGKVSLLEAFACLERSRLYLGNDSGLMHLAAASGVPTLGLFGPTPDEHYGPWGPNCRVVRGQSARDSYPDKVFMFDHANTGTLMEGLSVDLVEQAAIRLFTETARATV